MKLVKVTAYMLDQSGCDASSAINILDNNYN